MTTLNLEIGDQPIVCTLTQEELSVRRDNIAVHIAARHNGVRELADGYALRFPGDDSTAHELLTFILGERACCRFFTFELHFEADEGALWLCIRGPEGVKDLVRSIAGIPTAISP